MVFMKKVLVVLLVVAMAVFCLVCVNRINKLEAEYNENLESMKAEFEATIESMTNSYEQLNASKADLENQICNYMTGRASGIRVEHEDEIQYWVHKNHETLFTEKANLICYEK
jgi:hypothetical protein